LLPPIEVMTSFPRFGNSFSFPFSVPLTPGSLRGGSFPFWCRDFSFLIFSWGAVAGFCAVALAGAQIAVGCFSAGFLLSYSALFGEQRVLVSSFHLGG